MKFSKSTLTIAVLVVGSASIVSGFIPGVLVSLAVLGTLAIFPQLNPLVYWPIGFFGTYITVYGAYVTIWLLGFGGLTPRRAQMVLLTTVILFSAVALRRLQKRNYLNPQLLKFNWVSLILLACTTLSILIIGIHHFYFDKTGMIAGFLAGGDHGPHIEVTLKLHQGNTFAEYTNPFSLAYPNGIHFLIANLQLVHFVSSSDSQLVQQHLVPAFFEYIQLAAVVHLVVLSAIRIRVRHEVLRALLITGSLFCIASIDKLGNYLFWSGFTTSLGLTWILLLAFLVFGDDVFESTYKNIHLYRMTAWTLIAFGILITYQPYILIPVVCFAIELLNYIFQRSRRKQQKSTGYNELYLRSTLIFVGVGSMIAGFVFIQGADSSTVRGLILWGVTWTLNPNVTIVAAVVAFLFVGLASATKKHFPEVGIDGMFLSGITALTLAMAIVAAWASPIFTIKYQPYYVQKMIWILFIISITLVLKWGPAVIEKLMENIDSKVGKPFLVILSLMLFFLPSTWNRSPLEATRHIAIDWFAEGMFVDVKDIRPYRAAVFNTWENLGAHVGNIALRQMSPTILPIDIAQSRNTQWACWYMRNQNVNLIYTATGQGAALIEAGCDQYATYIENGTRYDRLIPQAPALMLGKQVLASTTSEDAGYLSTGFFATEDSKIWATGFHSSVQMSAIESRTNLEMLFNLQRNTNHQFPVTIQTYINGRQIDSSDLGTDQKTKTIMIPEINRNDHLSFQFVCQRSNDEVLETTNSGNPELLKCVGLEDFRVNASTT